MSIQIPTTVAEFHDNVFADVVDYLRETGEVSDAEVVTALDLEVRAEEAIIVKNVETNFGDN